MVPSTGLYSDVTSVDNPHEPESIVGTTILTILLLLLSNNELQNHAIERKKLPGHEADQRYYKVDGSCGATGTEQTGGWFDNSNKESQPTNA
jgi:hypothetical protein